MRKARIAEQLLFLAVVFGLNGCRMDFTSATSDITTSAPNEEQVAYCRKVMYVSQGLEIKPLGYSIRYGLDDVIRFKFLAYTDDPGEVFESTFVDKAKFNGEFSLSALKPESSEPWWEPDVNAKLGANLSVPPPDSKGTRGLNIAFEDNGDDTLTVYVLWHET